MFTDTKAVIFDGEVEFPYKYVANRSLPYDTNVTVVVETPYVKQGSATIMYNVWSNYVYIESELKDPTYIKFEIADYDL